MLQGKLCPEITKIRAPHIHSGLGPERNRGTSMCEDLTLARGIAKGVVMKKKVLGIVGSLEIELEGIGELVLMVLSGQIDNYTSEEITKIINEYIDKGNLKVIIDLTKVDYLDSSGLSALITAKIRLSKRKGDLRLVGLKGKAKEVFDLANLTSMFDIYDNRESAFEGFQENRLR